MRGRVLRIPNIKGLRPTPSKVREALFSILGDIEGLSMLDLFSGSGLMALESISRGASSATSIEEDIKACKSMQILQQDWKVQDWQILPAKLPKALSKLQSTSFDLIFADPPYDQGLAKQIPRWLDQHGITCQTLVIEEASKVQPDWPQGWTLLQSRRYGETCIHILKKT
ncbi:MAG: 16S rRNA (guanine(966)-N(2))-methyltransferase RsmD [Mariprofundaceae bacterium]